MAKTRKTSTKTAPCGCSITGRFVTGRADCAVVTAYRIGEITGSAMSYHYNKAGLR